MKGYGSFVGTWPFASILAFALTLAFDCVVIEMPKLTPLYPKGWALKQSFSEICHMFP